VTIDSPQLFLPHLPAAVSLGSLPADPAEAWDDLGSAVGVQDSVELTTSPAGNPWADAEKRLQEREMMLRIQNENERLAREAAHRAKVEAEAAKAKEEAKKNAGAEE
jgi:hypothetical protein